MNSINGNLYTDYPLSPKGDLTDQDGLYNEWPLLSLDRPISPTHIQSSNCITGAAQEEKTFNLRSSDDKNYLIAITSIWSNSAPQVQNKQNPSNQPMPASSNSFSCPPWPIVLNDWVENSSSFDEEPKDLKRRSNDCKSASNPTSKRARNKQPPNPNTSNSNQNQLSIELETLRPTEVNYRTIATLAEEVIELFTEENDHIDETVKSTIQKLKDLISLYNKQTETQSASEILNRDDLKTLENNFNQMKSELVTSCSTNSSSKDFEYKIFKASKRLDDLALDYASAKQNICIKMLKEKINSLKTLKYHYEELKLQSMNLALGIDKTLKQTQFKEGMNIERWKSIRDKSKSLLSVASKKH